MENSAPMVVKTLYYENDTNLIPRLYSEIDSIEYPQQKLSMEIEPLAVPPLRPPRKFDSPAREVSVDAAAALAAAAAAEKNIQQTTKVELYTRRSSSASNGPSAPVPVLGVQQAMAMHRRQHDYVVAIDGQQPSTSEHDLKTINEGERNFVPPFCSICGIRVRNRYGRGFFKNCCVIR